MLTINAFTGEILVAIATLTIQPIHTQQNEGRHRRGTLKQLTIYKSKRKGYNCFHERRGRGQFSAQTLKG